MDTPAQQEQNEARSSGSLPPEVEAELRRRLAEQARSPAPAEPAAGPAAQGAHPIASPTAEAPSPADAAPDPQPTWLDRLKVLGPIGVFLVFWLGKLKFLAFALKFIVPVLQTGGTMLLSIAFYAWVGGWGFGVGFVLSILVHEMGHVFVAWRMGIPVSAPLFIPGMGALIIQKQAAKSTWDEALIGIGGPVAGTLAGLVCMGLYELTGLPLMRHLAYTGFLINLFNLMPIMPLDGGWITAAISPRIWLIGMIGMVALFVTGTVRNPFILFLLLLSLPRLIHGLRTGSVTPEGGVETTPRQKLVMGVSYVGLAGLLLWLMALTFAPL